MRLQIDEDAMHHDLLSALRARHVDVLTVFEAGLTVRSDEAQLCFAAEQGRVLYSFNVGEFSRRSQVATGADGESFSSCYLEGRRHERLVLDGTG
jgi:hypothetical protein